MKPAILHREAEAELNAAIEYYEKQARGLGLDLVAEVERGIDLIVRFPEAWPLDIKTRHRKVVLRRFPFALHFMEHADIIWINAVAHAKRSPGYWRARAM